MSVYRVRLSSPLRWLWAVMSALAILALAAVVQSPWVLVAIPPLAATLLLAPPIGIFRHDETPPARTGLSLVARPAGDASAPGTRYLLVLVNGGEVDAEDFRIRLILPPALAPPGAPLRPLGRTFAGAYGTHWFIESLYDATAITFRSGGADEASAVRCPAGSQTELAELRIVARGRLAGTALEYQVSGGNVRAALGRLVLPDREE